MRQQGHTIPHIEKEFGIPRSTLSGWFRNIKLSPSVQKRIQKRKNVALAQARKKAVLWHNDQKKGRLHRAKQEARALLTKLPEDNNVHLELALAFLYLGEGAKGTYTGIGNTNPTVLRFFISSIRTLYGVPITSFKCELHLRADQNPITETRYWSRQLEIPPENFGKPAIDARTAGRPTYAHYHGVCTIRCGQVAIRRKLMYIADIFCAQIAK